MSPNPSSPSGVMHGDYAEGRQKRSHLIWRYRVRAAAAVAAYRKLSPLGAMPRVLDLGAAEGLTLLEMRRLLGSAGKYDGIELSTSLLAAAPPLPSGVRLVEGDVMRLPAAVEGDPYDLVTALAVLEHLPDPEACLAEAFRVLEPGGVVVASCPNPFWDEVAGRLRLVADEHHEQHLDGEAMRRMLRGAGFEQVAYEPFMWAPVGLLPYFRVDVPVERALEIDAWVRRIRRSGFSFVNQLVAAKKPLR